MSRRPVVPVVLTIVALSLMWGTAFVAIKEALAAIGPVDLAILRFAVADLFLIALMIVAPSARPRFARGDRWRIGALAILGVPAYHLTLNWGEQRTSAGVAALIVATAPVMVAGLSWFTGERLRPSGVAGIALAFGGVAVLTAPGGDGTASGIAGPLVTVCAPVAWALYTIVAKPLARPGDALRVTAASLTLGSLALLPFVRPSTLHAAASLGLGPWMWIVFLGGGASAAGYVMFVWALGRLGATKVSVSIYLVPLFALLMEWAIRDEAIHPSVAASGALVIAGVVLTQRGVEARTPLPPIEG